MARPDDAELRNLSEHVLLYEFEMLDALADEILRIALSQELLPPWWHTNAYLESFGIHARQLEEILYGSPGSQSGEVFAVDYFDAPGDWRSVRGKKPRELSPAELSKRVGAEIAHATRGRARISKKRGWSTYKIYTSVADVMERFAEAVVADRVIPDFDERVETALPDKQPLPVRPHRPGSYSVTLPSVPTQGLRGS